MKLLLFRAEEEELGREEGVGGTGTLMGGVLAKVGGVEGLICDRRWPGWGRSKGEGLRG